MMNNNSNNPSDFSLFLASDTLLGVLEAIYRMAGDPPEDEAERALWVNALSGLAWAGVKAAREANTFLTEASESHRFPATYADIESGKDCVRETPPMYLVR